MRTTKGYIFVISVMLCIAGLCTYGLQQVVEDEHSVNLWVSPTPMHHQSSFVQHHIVPSAQHNFKASPIQINAVTSPMSVKGGMLRELPTYSGNTARSYGGSMEYGLQGSRGASTLTNGLSVPIVAVSPIAQPTANAISAQVIAPGNRMIAQGNRMLAQGRMQMVNNYKGMLAISGEGMGEMGSKSGPMKLSSIGDTWQKWYEEYLAYSGKTSVTDSDLADMQSWWNSTHGGNGYTPDIWNDFWTWVPKTVAPLGDGILCCLLLCLVYCVYRKYKLQTSK